MPKVTIWIREQDFKYWQDITNKPDFIHNVLTKPNNPLETADRYITNKLTESFKDNSTNQNIDKDDNTKFCKHNQVVGFCKQGCK